jgi:two-component system, NtrC family, sensor kinase
MIGSSTTVKWLSFPLCNVAKIGQPMLQSLQDFFSGNFMAHGYCFLWKPELVGLHAGSDFLIALAYYSIPVLLLYFVRQRQDIPFQGIFLLFSTFILSCGTGHLLEILTLWHPAYWLSGAVKAFTAIVSLYTASEMVSLIPKALALPSPAQLAAANLALEKEIAEHKQTVEALKRSQQRLSLLVQQTPLAVIEWNLNGEVCEWNPAAERIFGYDKHQAIGHHACVLMMPSCEKEEYNEVWQKLLTSQGGSCMMNEYYTPDGRSLFCEWYNIPLIESNGSAIGVASLVQDVTQRKEAEDALRRAKDELEQRVVERTRELARANEVLQQEMIERQLAKSALRESETRLQTVVTQAPIILYATDDRGQLTLLEGKGLERLGHPPGKVVEQSDLNLYRCQLQILDNLPDVLEGVDKAWTVNVGDSVYQNRVTPLRDSNGHVTGLIGVATDITQRHQAEAALRRSEAQLREQATQLEQTLHKLKDTQTQLVQSEKMYSLGMMVAGIAHEINNPVGFVYGNITPASEYIKDLLELINLYRQHYPNPVPIIQEHAETIDLDFIVDDLPNLLRSMKVGAERIRDIIASLRTFSRLDQAQMKRVNIHEGLDATLLILQHRLKEKPGRPAIEVIKQYDSIPLVECFSGQINQVFMNILANAVDALESMRVSSEEVESDVVMTHPSPRIQICTTLLDASESHSKSQSIVIRISDNGPGMTERVRLLLFDPFFTTKPVGQGTGLGLSISYQIIVAKHGGQLRCVSAPGEGTEFIIEIPVQPPNGVERTAKSNCLKQRTRSDCYPIGSEKSTMYERNLM